MPHFDGDIKGTGIICKITIVGPAFQNSIFQSTKSAERIDRFRLTAQSANQSAKVKLAINPVILSGENIGGKLGRKGKSKVYPYNRDRLGKIYPEKRIEVYFTEEEDTFVTVTVYVFYGKWE